MNAVILILLIAAAAVGASRAAIIESCAETVGAGKAEFTKSKGGPENNRFEVVSSPVRAGTSSFKHWVNTRGERSELAMAKTEIGRAYWYGWSMLFPQDFDFTGSKTIVMQLATWPTPRDGRFPCGANGSFMHVDAMGSLVIHLQSSGGDKDMVCEKFTVLDDVSAVRGKWMDFVMHAKWTGDPDGFLKLWVKVHADDLSRGHAGIPAGQNAQSRGVEKQAGKDAGAPGTIPVPNYVQAINYTGRTFWNDEDKGPYFKMGLYTGEPGWKGPPERTVFTDEYRLGDSGSSFAEVAPGAAPRVAATGNDLSGHKLLVTSVRTGELPLVVESRRSKTH
jgi:hypothetical protein